jgi:uncharacterized protein YceK
MKTNRLFLDMTLYNLVDIIIIIIIIIITITNCSWVVTRWQYRQNKYENIYTNETIQKHSTNNTKHSKYKYTYY